MTTPEFLRSGISDVFAKAATQHKEILVQEVLPSRLSSYSTLKRLVCLVPKSTQATSEQSPTSLVGTCMLYGSFPILAFLERSCNWLHLGFHSEVSSLFQ